MRPPVLMFVAIGAIAILPAADERTLPPQTTDSYLTWTAAQAKEIGRSSRITGRVGGIFDLRVTGTDRSFNYKLRATWMAGPVIRASARLVQLAERLTDSATTDLVKAAETGGGATIMVEIDPREGSGVIPSSWVALFGPRSSGADQPELTRGESRPALREVRALSGVFPRDYDYEVFWVVFPSATSSGKPLLPDGVAEAELVVRIYNKEGRVRWPVRAQRPSPPLAPGTDTRSK